MNILKYKKAPHLPNGKWGLFLLKIANLDNSVGDRPSGETDTVWDKIGILYQYPKIYHIAGYLAKSSDNTTFGNGVATITLFPNRIAKIDYEYKLTACGTSTSLFTWGLWEDRLRILAPTLPKITPIDGGTLQMYNSSGAIKVSSEGFGGTHSGNGKFWCPTRCYSETGGVGNLGAWALNEFSAECRFVGTCYGTF